jgi:hypothetical protein
VSRDGLTHTRSFALFDADGGSQSMYDEAATAAINFRAALSGFMC